jgi:hypothetical protein
MKEHYYDRLGKATVKLELARIGYEREIKVVAEKLLNEDASLHGPIIDRIVALRVALEEMVDEAKYFKAKYQEECDKEVDTNADIRK